MSEALEELSHDCFSRLLEKLNNIEHIKLKNTTYCKHFSVATNMGYNMIKGGLALMIHAIYPNIFKSIGSDIIKKLSKEIETKK